MLQGEGGMQLILLVLPALATHALMYSGPLIVNKHVNGPNQNGNMP